MNRILIIDNNLDKINNLKSFLAKQHMFYDLARNNSELSPLISKFVYSMIIIFLDSDFKDRLETAIDLRNKLSTAVITIAENLNSKKICDLINNNVTFIRMAR
ncbi:MAG: hypothetical protein K9N40_04625 [Candidatus Cloacimonetes bacterium]|nr:hypothetical protein [Candidatus Cloacimonadota bacterium]